MRDSEARARTREARSATLRTWRGAARVVLVLNLGFILAAFGTNVIPQSRIVERVRQAFSDGELVERDFLHGDTRRGQNQYADCTVLQLLTNPDDSLIGRALGPWLQLRELADESCATLKQLISAEDDGHELFPQRYTRYWNGNLPATGVLLSVAQLATVRSMLRLGVYASVVLVLLAGVAQRPLLPVMAPIAFMGLFAWSLPSFGMGLSHAYGDASTMLGIALLVYFRQRFTPMSQMLAFSAGFGAVVCYFDMLTGALPIAAGLLYPLAYFVSRAENAPGTSASQHLRYATASLIAFALGATLTLALHTALVAGLVRPHGLGGMSDNLLFYMQPVDGPVIGFGWFDTMLRLIRRGSILTGGSSTLWLALLGASAVAWSIGGALAWRSRQFLERADFFALVIGAASVPVWVAILQTHTFVHADFMVRILLAPIALGFAALLSQVNNRRASSAGI